MSFRHLEVFDPDEVYSKHQFYGPNQEITHYRIDYLPSGEETIVHTPIGSFESSPVYMYMSFKPYNVPNFYTERRTIMYVLSGVAQIYDEDLNPLGSVTSHNSYLFEAGRTYYLNVYGGELEALFNELDIKMVQVEV